MSLPIMSLLLIPVEGIIDITIVDILNFQKFCFRTLGVMENCAIFKFFAIAKFWQYAWRVDKLNGHTKRKTEYFSFLKHPFQRQNTSNRSTMTITPHTAAAAASAAMTASEQQTGVITRINE